VLLDLRGPGPLGRRVEEALRAAVRAGRLEPGDRLPSTRTLARDLGVSRRLVVEAYAQLTSEGLLEARQGSGTRVAARSAAADAPRRGAAPARPARPAYDFFPGVPDLTAFPRAAWQRALRTALSTAPASALHYPDPAGAPELRAALAAHLARSRGVETTPQDVVVTAGARQALQLLARVLARRGQARVAVEDPTLPPHVHVLRAAGARTIRVPVDADGIDTARLAGAAADAVLVTPAHQFPLGVALAPERRTALLEWASAAPGRLVIEDDYDGELRYDRRPVRALQGRAPELVAYVGSVSKALAPALRIGWIAAPPGLAAELARERELLDGGNPVLDQLALAELLGSAAYDRQIRLARRRNRARRDALVAALATHVPGARVTGLAAGLHVVVRLRRPVAAAPLAAALAAREVGVVPLLWERESTSALVLGYAALPEPALAEGVRRLAAALAEAA
jgi:GntR family transcriptional regulator/MocR family aminotransferase